MRTLRAGIAAIVLIAFTTATGRAMWLMDNKDVPLDRLLTNVERQVRQHPKDARGHYVLGRLHSLAYATTRPTVSVRQEEGKPLPGFAAYESVQVRPEWFEALKQYLLHHPDKPAPPPPEAALKHLAASIREYRTAVKLAPKDALYHLGLGWMLEQASLFSADDSISALATSQPASNPTAPAATQPNEPARIRLLREALDHYVRAVDLSLQKDLQGTIQAGDMPISAEAANNALRILTSIPNPDPAVLAHVKGALEQVQQVPMAVTPIVFSLDRSRPLDELVDPDARSTFDLAGTGRGEIWPWVRPQTAILAWDPRHTGRITSGRQLFGSVTWWMFFPDGYAALAALDDDGDGLLTGPELAGIAIWQDRNGNGRSDPGEVESVQSAGITAINVRPTRGPEGLSSLRGIRLRDGRWLCTHDWVPVSLPASPGQETDPLVRMPAMR